MYNEKSGIEYSYPPHIKTKQTVTGIMWSVVIALLPANICAVFLYGLNPLYLILSAVSAAVAAEAVFQIGTGKQLTVHDGSAVITGMLFAMNIPPYAPLWVAPAGAVFAVIVIKQLFGGLGRNIFNPALSARALIAIICPTCVAAAVPRFFGSEFSAGAPAFDAVTQAVNPAIPVAGGIYKALLANNAAGYIGEASLALLLAGAVFLLFRKIITWHAPAAFIGTVAVFIFLYYKYTGIDPVQGVIYHICTGSLLLGAFFMATDPVTTPLTRTGLILFGTGCGLLTCVIRIWFGHNLGVCWAILLMNAVTPLIDRYIRPKLK